MADRQYSRKIVLEIDGQPVIDWDDSQLYRVAQALVDALPTADGRGARSVGSLRGEAAAVAARAGMPQATGAQDKEQREAEQLASLGRELARHFILVMVNRGAGWDSIRPGVLDTRSTLETGLDMGADFLGGTVGEFVPDGMDIFRPGGVQQGGADNIAFEGAGWDLVGQGAGIALDLFQQARGQ